MNPPRGRLLAVFALAALGIACVHRPATRAYERHRRLLAHGPGAPLLVVAHRGLWREAPENSLRAIELAVAAGADIVEVDVRRTRDGELVLMHDPTVDRTTTGSGKVADLTRMELRSLRLRKALGFRNAEVTDETVPTLAEALQVVKGRAFLALDKGWPVRNEMLAVLRRTGTVGDALFIGNPPVAEAAEFLAAHPEVFYVHLVDRENALDIGSFPRRSPVAYSLVFERLDEPQVRPDALAKARATSRVWMNTMWYGFAGRYTDEASLRDPALGWKPAVELGADVIQTDQVRALTRFRRGEPESPAVRIEAEAFVAATAGPTHRHPDPRVCEPVRNGSGTDVCDFNGAIAVTATSPGDSWRYRFRLAEGGRYRVSARVSSGAAAGGLIALAWDTGPPGKSTPISSTTHHSVFELQPLEERAFSPGEHELAVRVMAGMPAEFNIDSFRLERVAR